MITRVGFLAAGKAYLVENGQAREVESEFAEQARERHERAQQRHSWKNESKGMYAPWNVGGDLRQSLPVRITGLARSDEGDAFFFLLRTDAVGGLFRATVDGRSERRIFHKEAFEATDLSYHPSEDLLVCARQIEDVANLFTLSTERFDPEEITEGDSVDSAPAWVLGKGKQIVYQSAGVGRTNDGYFAGLGPSSIEWADLESGEHKTLLSSDTEDYLLPRMDAAGKLYCLRRPHEAAQKLKHLSAVKEFFLVPYRLLQAGWNLANMLSQVLNHKPLASTTNNRKVQADSKIYLRGQLIDLAKLEKSGDDDAVVPRNWELIRRAPDGSITVLENRICAFDLLADGSLLLTNGRRIWQRSEDDKTEVYKGKELISEVVGW